jgi:hypothetical protein
VNSGRNSLLIVGVLIVAFYLWMQSQSKTRGMATAKTKLPVVAPGGSAATQLGKLLGGLLGTNKQPTSSGGGKSGGGAGSGSGAGTGAGTAGGQKACNKTPGTSFCGCNSCLAYAGQDSSGNEIYQRPDGSLVYADGSPANENDIVCADGACAGTAFNMPGAASAPQGPVQCQPQCVDTAQPCFNPGACGGCAGGGCFCCC